METTRQRAREKGDSYYDTGLPCIHGHYSKRTALSGNCMQCYTTTHFELKKAYADKRRITPKFRRRKSELNAITARAAGNHRQAWTLRDIEQILLRGVDGEYTHPELWLAKKLGRSGKAVQKARHRYREDTDTLPTP